MVKAAVLLEQETQRIIQEGISLPRSSHSSRTSPEFKRPKGLSYAGTFELALPYDSLPRYSNIEEKHAHVRNTHVLAPRRLPG